MESSMEIPLETKNRTANDPVTLLLDTYTKGCKSGYNRDTCTLVIIAALFTIAKLWKQPRCVIYWFYSSIKKKKTYVVCK
jgi:hypothetical protein